MQDSVSPTHYKNFGEYGNVVDNGNYNVMRKTASGLYEIKIGNFSYIGTGAFFADNQSTEKPTLEDLLINITQRFQEVPKNMLGNKNLDGVIFQELFKDSKAREELERMGHRSL